MDKILKLTEHQNAMLRNFCSSFARKRFITNKSKKSTFLKDSSEKHLHKYGLKKPTQLLQIKKIREEALLPYQIL